MTRTALAFLATSAVLATSSPRSSIGALDSETLVQRPLAQRLPLALSGEKTRHTKAQSIRFLSEEVVRDTAQQAATKMMEVVKTIQTEVDQLLKTAQESKDEFLREVDSMAATAPDILIPEFAVSANKLVHRVDARWKALGDVANESASTIASAFKAASQEKLGTSLEPGVDSAVQCLSKFLEKLDSANVDVQNSANNFAANHSEALLKRLDKKLNEALQHLSQFIMQFQGAFTELFDSLSNAVCWNHADAKEAFKPVRQRVVAIVWRFRSAGQDGIFPIPMGLVRIAEKAGMPTPIWHPAEIQVQRRKNDSGSSRPP